LSLRSKDRIGVHHEKWRQIVSKTIYFKRRGWKEGRVSGSDFESSIFCARACIYCVRECAWEGKGEFKKQEEERKEETEKEEKDCDGDDRVRGWKLAVWKLVVLMRNSLCVAIGVTLWWKGTMAVLSLKSSVRIILVDRGQKIIWENISWRNCLSLYVTCNLI